MKCDPVRQIQRAPRRREGPHLPHKNKLIASLLISWRRTSEARTLSTK